MKTLVVILHHNTPEYTDQLYELLEPEQKTGNYDLLVIDNGSDLGKESKYATHRLDENVFFGGGLDASMEMTLESSDYDSLLFLNSDLIIGKNFVASLRKESLKNKIDILSPCILQPEKTQNHWRQMLPYGTNTTREVKWIDLQSPFISKDFIKELHDERNHKNFVDPLLLRGWGLDIYFGIIAEQIGWKIGVCDFIPAIHLGSMTMKALGNSSEYCQLAENGQWQFFQNERLTLKAMEMRKWSEDYTI